MEISQAVRFAYFDAIGTVTNVPIFDVYALPEGTPYPYILLSTQTSVQRIIKRCKVYDASILIDIVTGESNGYAGRIQAEDIAEKIEQVIIPDDFSDLDLSVYGYSIGDTRMEMDTDSSLMNGTTNIYRKLIRYSHIISKLTINTT